MTETITETIGPPAGGPSKALLINWANAFKDVVIARNPAMGSHLEKFLEKAVARGKKSNTEIQMY